MSQITVRIDGQEKLSAAFGRVTQTARQRLKNTLWLLSIMLREKIQREKLSGQVLHQRTGRLKGSIHEEIDETSDAIVATVGTNVEYARPHEYGFSGSVQIKAHMRTIKQAWGKPITPREVAVRTHTRKVNISEKRFMRDSLDEFHPTVQQRLVRLARDLAQEASK